MDKDTEKEIPTKVVKSTPNFAKPTTSAGSKVQQKTELNNKLKNIGLENKGFFKAYAAQAKRPQTGKTNPVS